MIRRYPKPREQGTSIIEVIVVLAIIAILASILLPLLSRSRQKSHQALCACNLRQFAEAFSLYANDWAGRWPAPGGLYGDRTYWSQSGSGGLESYIRNRGIESIWCCPLLTEWSGRFPPRSYSMNSYLRGIPDVEYPLCLNILNGIESGRIPAPGKTILLFEGMPLTDAYRENLDYLYRCANWSRTRGFTDRVAFTIEPGKPWHGRVNNYLYCDGHVQARPPGKYMGGNSLSSGSEMFQWYVNKGDYMDRYKRLYARTVPW